MKTLIKFVALLVVFTLAFNQQANAQKMSEGTSIVRAGIGLGSSTYDYTTSETPLILLTYEQGIKDDFLAGNISVGGTIGYKSGKYSYLDFGWNYTYFTVAGRANWHPDFIKSDKWDAYASLLLGMEFINVSSNVGAIGAETSGSSLLFGTMLGVRYDINENWGAWAELGFGLGLLDVGVSYKF